MFNVLLFSKTTLYLISIGYAAGWPQAGNSAGAVQTYWDPLLN